MAFITLLHKAMQSNKANYKVLNNKPLLWKKPVFIIKTPIFAKNHSKKRKNTHFIALERQTFPLLYINSQGKYYILGLIKSSQKEWYEGGCLVSRVMLAAVLVCSLSLPNARAECPVGDINGDCKVNMTDLAIMANQWLGGACDEPPCADLNSDGDVNFVDYTAMVLHCSA